jgi:hypothetical protein
MRCRAISYRTAAAAFAAFSELMTSVMGILTTWSQFRLAMYFRLRHAELAGEHSWTADGSGHRADRTQRLRLPAGGMEGPDRLTTGPSGSDRGRSPETQSVQVSDG